jgi:hypothetical protein
MRDALKEFRESVHRAGERNAPPTLQAILEPSGAVLQFRWAAAVIVVIGLGAIPVYRDARERQKLEEQQRADAQLMEQVNGALSRPVPVALSVLMGN